MPQILDQVDATFGMMGPITTQNVDLIETALAELFKHVSDRGIEISAPSWDSIRGNPFCVRTR
jgi:hypothetical protein